MEKNWRVGQEGVGAKFYSTDDGRTFSAEDTARARPATQAEPNAALCAFLAGEADPPPHQPRHAASLSSALVQRRCLR